MDGRRVDQQMNELRDLEVVRRYRWIIQIRHDQILLRGVRIGLDPPHRGPVNAAALECGSLQIRPDQQCCHQGRLDQSRPAEGPRLMKGNGMRSETSAIGFAVGCRLSVFSRPLRAKLLAPA